MNNEGLSIFQVAAAAGGGGGGGGGSGTVTSVNTDSTLTGGPITTTGTLGVAATVLNDIQSSKQKVAHISASFPKTTTIDIGAIGVGGKFNVVSSTAPNFDIFRVNQTAVHVQLELVTDIINPSFDNAADLGSTAFRWRDGHFSQTLRAQEGIFTHEVEASNLFCGTNNFNATAALASNSATNILFLEQKTDTLAVGPSATVINDELDVTSLIRSFSTLDTDVTYPSISTLGGVRIAKDLAVASINGVVHIRQASDVPAFLVANTSYIVHGEITLSGPIEVNVEGCSIRGNDRAKDRLILNAEFNTLFGIDNVNFSIDNLGITAWQGLYATNYSSLGNYNYNRNKVLTITNCEFRGCFNVMEIVGFDLVDILNVLVWYTVGDFGCTFRDTSKLQITSSEFIRWFAEGTLPTPANFSTASMVQLRSNGPDNAGFGAVTITSNIFHPQETQRGIDINNASSAGFATLSSNTFVNTGLTTGSVMTYDIDLQPSYVIEANQGVKNGTAVGELKLINNIFATPVFTVGVPYPVNANTAFIVPAATSRFTGTNTGNLIYNAKNPTQVYVSCTCSGEMENKTDKELTFYIGKNGVVLPELSADVEFKGGLIRTVSWSGVTSAEQGDIFDVWVANNQDLIYIDVSSLKLTIFSL